MGSHPLQVIEPPRTEIVHGHVAGSAATVVAPPERFFGVQLLRGLAASLVVVHHANVFFAVYHRGKNIVDLNGAAGVDIFFVISGFVMYSSALLAEQRGTSRRFLDRRFLRVAPPYYLLTAVKIVLLLAIPGMFLGAHLQTWNTVASFLFFPASNSQGALLPVIPPGWTLNYEMFFYLLLYGILVARLRLLRSAAIFLLLAAAVNLLLPARWRVAGFLTSPIILEFLLGMCLGAFVQHAKRIPRWAGWVLAAASSLAILLPSWSMPIDGTNYRLIVWGLPAALLVTAMVSLENKVSFKTFRNLLLLGDASYALYLTHIFVVPAVAKLCSRYLSATPLAIAGYLALVACLSYAVAVLFHLRFEMPLYRRLTTMRLPWALRSEAG